MLSGAPLADRLILGNSLRMFVHNFLLPDLEAKGLDDSDEI